MNQITTESSNNHLALDGRAVGVRAATLVVALAMVGCGAGAAAPPKRPASVNARRIAASMQQVLITTFHAPTPVSTHCPGGLVHDGQILSCTAISSAGRGYRVKLKLPCWSATYNGMIIEGPGFALGFAHPAGRSTPSRGSTAVASGPDNLPDRFSGCVK